MRFLRITVRLVAFACVLAAVLGMPASTTAQPKTLLRLQPDPLVLQAGSEALVAVRVENVTDLWAFKLVLRFDPQAIEVLSVESGGFLRADYVPVREFKNTDGTIQFDLSQGEDGSGVSAKSGSGDLLHIRIRALRDLPAVHAMSISTDSRLVDGTNYLPIEYEVYAPLMSFLPLVIR